MKRLFFALTILSIAALSPAPINDPRGFVKSPELSDAQRQEQQRGVTMGEVGATPADTEVLPAPSITGDSGASDIIKHSDDKGQGRASDSALKGAAAIQEVSREIAQRDQPNWGRIFFGGLIVVAAFGLFQVFRMWANKSLPDAPTNYR